MSAEQDLQPKMSSDSDNTEEKGIVEAAVDKTKELAGTITETVKGTLETGKEMIVDAYDLLAGKSAEDEAKKAADETAEKTGEVRDKASDKWEELKEGAGDKWEDVKKGAKDMKRKAEDKVDEVKDKATDKKDEVEHKAKRGRHCAQQKVDDAKEVLGVKLHEGGRHVQSH